MGGRGLTLEHDGRWRLEAAGRTVARLRIEEDEGYDIAVEPGVGDETAADALLAEMTGWRVAAPPGVGRILLSRGATLRRHAHTLSRDLRADPPDPAWAEAAPPAGTTWASPVYGEGLVATVRAAFPPGHPDHHLSAEDDRSELRELMAGRLVGPVLDCSTVALDAHGQPVAGAIVTDRPGDPPWAGPWLTLTFRHPELGPRGSGRAALERALAGLAASGRASMSLVVSAGNDGPHRLYRRLGFEPMAETVAVLLP